MVVLDELDVEPRGVAQDALVVALEEEASLVAKDLGLENQDIRDVGADDLH
jgi:hydrogenase maturation factor HypE